MAGVTLTLSIPGAGPLDNGAPSEFVLHRRGGVIGRSPTCDWSLPDPRNYVSSRHLEVRYDNGAYVLTDLSTNGTFLNGATERMAAPRRVENGDRFHVGHYEIRATLTGDDAGFGAVEAAAPSPAWRGWEGAAGAPEPLASLPGVSSGWDAAPPPPQGARWQPEVGPSLARPEPHRTGGRPPSPASGGWAPAARAPEAPVASAWAAAIPAPEPASGWSSAAPDRPSAPSPDDVWGRIAEGNVVDWARGGFGQPVEPRRDPLGLQPAPASDALPRAVPQAVAGMAEGWGSAPAQAVAAPPAPPPPPPPPVPARDDGFLLGAGLDPARVTFSPALSERAGQLFRRLVAGLVVMVEARARAKSQLGAEPTAFSPEGHNPFKYARTPDEAIAMLLAPAPTGFMPAERAIEDAFEELQSHQMATLRAMQGALGATLERFSPDAIRKRAAAGGLLERILPAARDAALWQAYEREFGGVARGSDEAFMDVFAAEFRRAYNDQARRAPR
jgi:type VI secretion system FHA domain protein